MNKIILIPTYEPDNKLIELLKTIKEYNIIVVNDGSSNEYDSIFEEAKKYANVLSYDNNHGKGYALKYGLKYIKYNYKNYIVTTMDGDGQHTISDANKLIDYISEHKEELALGKREWDKNTPLRSRIGNTLTRFIFNKLTKLEIYDTQTGLRSFSNELIDYMLSINGERYEYEMNVLLNLKNNNIKYKEINIQTIYIDDNKGSHYSTIKDSFRIYKTIKSWKKENKK